MRETRFLGFCEITSPDDHFSIANMRRRAAGAIATDCPQAKRKWSLSTPSAKTVPPSSISEVTTNGSFSTIPATSLVPRFGPPQASRTKKPSFGSVGARSRVLPVAAKNRGGPTRQPRSCADDQAR